MRRFILLKPLGLFVDPSPAATRLLLSWISAILRPLREASLLLRAAHPRPVEVTAGRSSGTAHLEPHPYLCPQGALPTPLPDGRVVTTSCTQGVMLGRGCGT